MADTCGLYPGNGRYPEEWLFYPEKIGMHGKPFRVIKIRTMRKIDSFTTCVTTARDPRITLCGRFFRNTKIDELPQLVNVLLGHMSFVGPRPDVPGFADSLTGDDRVILSIRPGITATGDSKIPQRRSCWPPGPSRKSTIGRSFSRTK